MPDPQVRRGLAQRSLPSPLITEKLSSSGGSFLSNLPWGAIGTGLSIVNDIAGWLRSRRERRDQLQAALRDANLFDATIDASVSDPQWVVGRAKTQGVVGPGIDSGKFSQQYATGNDGALLIRNIHTVTLLSAGEIADVEGMWANGIEVPIVGSVATRRWASSGWTAQPPLIRWLRNVLPGAGPLFDRQTALRTRMDALIPGWTPTTDSGDVNIPSGTDPVVLMLFNGLLAELNALIESARVHWIDNRAVKKIVGQDEVAAAEPVIDARLSFGSAADSAPTSIIQTYAKSTISSRTSGDGGSRPAVRGWLASDTFDGIAWALTKHRFWKRPGDSTEILPWSAVPTVEWQLRGGGDFDGNPAKLARAIYKMSPDPREDSDLEGLTAAIARCDEPIVARAMEYADAGRTDGQLDWSEYRKLLWPDEAYPAQAVQERVIAEVNAREAGPANAQPRFAVNRVFTAAEIESGEAIAIAEECMGGRFVEMPGKRILFRPAQPRSAVTTLGPGDRIEAPTWRMGKGGGQAANAFETILPADHERGWRPSTLPVSQIDVQVERDGLHVQPRQARGQIDNLSALRQDALILDRDSVDKREGTVIAMVESAADPRGLVRPMDVVSVEADYGNTMAEVQLVQPLAGRVRLVVREIDADTYADKYFATPLDRDPGPTSGGGLDLSGNMVHRFRQTAAGRLCDLELYMGEDVDEVEVEATWREREASTPPIADVVQHYRFAAPATGAWFVHTIKESAPPVSTVVPADVDDYVFEGHRNRELALRVVPRGDGVDGVDLGGLLIPPDVGGAVRILGVREDKIGDGKTFAGWLVQVVGIEVLDGSLVFSWDGGQSWATPRHYPGRR